MRPRRSKSILGFFGLVHAVSGPDRRSEDINTGALHELDRLNRICQGRLVLGHLYLVLDSAHRAQFAFDCDVTERVAIVDYLFGLTDVLLIARAETRRS